MLSILGLLSGLTGPISSIVSKIIDLQAQKQAAKSNEELATINAQLEEAHDRKAVLIAEAASKTAGTINASIRMLFALGPLVFLSKIYIWDKVIGAFAGCAGEAGKAAHCLSFNTDPLDANLWWVVLGTIGFYFLQDKFRNS